MQGEHPGLVTVGWAYGMPEAAMARALLESHGIMVFAQSWYTLTVHWHLSHAFGGIALCVPGSQRDAALEILADFVPARRKRGLWRLLVAVLVWVWLGFPPPPTGFILAGLRPAPARATTPLTGPA
jgi:hypothetical protein